MRVLIWIAFIFQAYNAFPIFSESFGIKLNSFKTNAISVKKAKQSMWFTPKKRINTPKTDLSSASFVESKPHSLNGNRLYQREKESLALANILLIETGISSTPLLDQSFGVGKTSFVFKFRKVIADLPLGSHPHSMHLLNDAVYLQCLFDEQFVAAVAQEVNDHPLDDVDYDRHIIEVIIEVLRVSCNRDVVLESLSLKGLMRALSMTKTKFIFHFDEVGLIESLGKEIAARILYRILNIGYALKSKQNHFYILSGRSSLLHMIGIDNNIMKKSSSSFQSPCLCKVIQLSCLTQDSIKQIFTDNRGDNLFHVWQITGGVPRAVTYWIIALKTYESDLPYAKDDVKAMNMLINQCSTTVSEADKKMFQTLLDLSWAEVDFDVSTAALQGIPVTSILAKYGLYTASVSPTRHRIVAPLYALRAIAWFPDSIMPITKHEDIGSRLEIGFRRILFSKLYLGEASKWTDIGLDFLDTCNIPFTRVSNSYPFPKISSHASAVIGDVEKCMNDIHHHISGDRRSTFPLEFLDSICSLMQPNQYYQALPKSGSADSFIKLSENTILKFQFKNFIKPFSEAALAKEVKKCDMHQWTVYLVIVCSSGHAIDGGTDQARHFDNGLVAILLSKNSVERYFGKHYLSENASKPMLEEAFNQLRV